MQGQARPRIEAVGVPEGRVMIKVTGLQRRSRELITCNGGSMRLLPASALRAGARRRPTQTEISEARKSDRKGPQHEAKHVRSAHCAGSALVKQLEPRGILAPERSGKRDDLHQAPREDLL